MFSVLYSDESNIIELESIWEAYQSLLVDQALIELQKPNQSSSLVKMISIKKLFKSAKMYMNFEEL